MNDCGRAAAGLAYLCLGFVMAAVGAEQGVVGRFPKPEEWPCYRRTGNLDAHSPMRGRITQPRITWRYFVGALETRLVIEPAPPNSTLQLPSEPSPAPAGTRPLVASEFQPAPSGKPEERATPTVIYADVLPDEPGLEKLEFDSAFNKPTTQGQWQGASGRCWAHRSGEWTKIWETPPIDLLFQPLPLAGDFDGDGRPEVAILPFHELLLLDARTGQVKDRCRFTDTRSYGFFGVYDFDRDGRAEFLIQADFSKHIDVLGFRDGRLRLLWQLPVELDISNPQKILRAAPVPVASLRENGRQEVVSTLFNDSGDGSWHVQVRAALTGQKLFDFPDEHLAALVDLDGDGLSELLTAQTAGGGVPAFGTLRVRSLKDNRVRVLWQQNHSAWQTWEPPLPTNVQSTATFGQRTVLSRVQSGDWRLIVVLLQPASDGHIRLSAAEWNGRKFVTRTHVEGRNLEALGIDEHGRLLIRCIHSPSSSDTLRVTGGTAVRHSTSRLGCSPGPVTVAWPKQSEHATLVVQGVGEELVMFTPGAGGRAPATPTLSHGSVSTPAPPPELGTLSADLKAVRLAGRGQSTTWPQSLGPVLADLAGDGRRQILLAGAAPKGCARLMARLFDGGELWHHDFPEIPGTPPVWNTGGVVLWQTGHFTDSRRLDVVVTVRRSMMHSEETLLLSGRDGQQLWRRARQVSQRGVGGAPFAMADFDGDGLDDVASLNPSILYVMQGRTGRDLIAQDATWKEVPAKPVYWGQPVAGDFMGEGRASLFFGGRSMTGLVRADGSLAWWDALDKSPSELPAFGDFDGDGRSECMGLGYEDGGRCYQLADGRVRWRFALPDGQRTAVSASADLDGDGRDEALFTAGQALYCVGAGPNGEAGQIRWRVEFPAAIGPPSVGRLSKDEGVSILVQGADGYVYCVR